MRLKSLTYTSRAAPDLSETDLIRIHESARTLNALDGVTGLLVFDGERFLQVIEGADEAIDDLVERLRRDQRHLAFAIRDARYVPARSFATWSMELVRVSAGFKQARGELAGMLSDRVTPDVRALVLGLAHELAMETPA